MCFSKFIFDSPPFYMGYLKNPSVSPYPPYTLSITCILDVAMRKQSSISNKYDIFFLVFIYIVSNVWPFVMCLLLPFAAAHTKFVSVNLIFDNLRLWN